MPDRTLSSWLCKAEIQHERKDQGPIKLDASGKNEAAQLRRLLPAILMSKLAVVHPGVGLRALLTGHKSTEVHA